MKTAQVRSLGKNLLPQMPGYTHKGLMLYASPLNHVLRGFYFEDSGFDPSAFYVWAFFLPLYIPATHVSFSFGKRLGEGSGKRWNLSDPRLRDELLACIQRDGLPFLAGVSHPSDVATAILRLGVDSDPYRLEAIAYSLTMVDDVPAAQRALERLTRSLDSGITWQAEMIVRATQLSRKLGVDPQEARRQLVEWEQATVKNLGLD
ncbi:MAG: hypothetical protein P4L84_19420 [Isosphaeraceae bacterium]|nr:hypothetical protein [Isosphaeraceae bacterium]